VAGSAGVLVTERTALQLSALAAVVNVLSTDVAIFPLNVFKRRPDGGRDHMADDPRDELLSLSPDGQRTAICWRQSWMVHALIYGNGYSEIQRTGRGMPAAFHLLSPDQTTSAIESGTGRLIYRQGDGKPPIPAENVLHLAGFGFDGLNGFPLVRLLRQAIGVGLAEEGYTADFYANGSEPGGTIEVPQKLGKDGRKNMREAWEEKHRGYGQRHRVAVLEQGASFKNTATDPERAQLVESRRFQAIEVARPWRVPPHKYGDYSQSHLANIEASNLDYLMTALMGWLVAIEQQCRLKLFTRAERLAGYYVEHNVNALLRGDILSRFEAYGRALADGWLNRDEVRARENLAPIGEEEGGSKYLVQMNQTTLDQIGEAEPGPAGGAEPPAEGILNTEASKP
jgi:HK97 family phage portal protein